MLDAIAPAPLPTRTPDRVASVVEEIAPTTSNLTAGFVVPIPTLPALVILSLSANTPSDAATSTAKTALFAVAAAVF